MSSLPPLPPPRLVERVLARVAAGTRRTRSLAEQLEVEPARVTLALEAAAWLGALELDEEPILTRPGLEIVYGRRGRRRAWRELVSTHPVLGPLTRPGGVGAGLTGPTLRTVTRYLARAGGGPDSDPRRQIALNFGSTPVPRRPRLDLRAGADDSPDVYTHLLRLLLDHGELTSPGARGALDAWGGAACGLGGYLHMAVRRGDATRLGDRLVITQGALQRADLAESPLTVALSDPDFRGWLTSVLRGERTGTARQLAWLTRFFPGWKAASDLPGWLSEHLDRALFGRALADLPVAGDVGPPLPRVPGPFLAHATLRGLVLAVPSDLAGLTIGLAGINRHLREGELSARPPSPWTTRHLVHGGLLAPGEAAPRSVPDGVSLRLRAASHVPAFTLLLALGVLHRRGTLQLRVRGPDVVLLRRGRPPTTAAALLQTLARARDWTLVLGPNSASWSVVAEVAEQLGLLTRVEDFLTVDEVFYARLPREAEHRRVWDDLLPLLDLLAARLGEAHD